MNMLKPTTRLRRLLLAGVGLTTTLLLTSNPLWAALTLTTIANPDPVRPGETMHMQLTVTNTDNFTRNAVTLETDLPAEIAAFAESLNSDGGNCIGSGCEPGETVTWTLDPLAPGAGRSVYMSITFPTGAGAPADGTQIGFLTRALDNAIVETTDTATVTIESDPVLELSLADNINPIPANGQITYTLTYGNRTLATPAPNTLLEFPLPAGTSFVSASDGGSLVGSTVQWDLSNLNPGQSGQRQVTVQAGALSEGTTLSTTASITDSTVPANQTRASGVNRVRANSPFNLAMAINPAPIRHGETMNVHLTATNTSGIDLNSGVVLELRYPDDLNALAETLSSDGGNCVGSACEARETMVWNLPPMAAGSGITVSLPPTVLAANSTPDGTVIRFDARIFNASKETVYTSRSIMVKAEPVMELTVSDDLDPIANNGQMTYTLDFGNRTLATPSLNPQISLPLPEGTSFIGASDGGSLVGNTVVWDLGNLNPGQTGQRQVLVQVDNQNDGHVLKAEAMIRDNSGTPQETWASNVSRVEANLPLSLSIISNPDAIRQGETLQTQLTVTNTAGFDIIGDVVLSLQYPDGLDALAESYVSHAGGCVGSACESREMLVWNIPGLAAGDAKTVTLPPIVSNINTNPNGTLIQFNARVMDAANNNVQATRVVRVDDDPVLELSIEELSDPVAADDLLSYELTYANRTPATLASNTVMSVAIPEGTSFVSASNGGTLVGNTVQWNLGNLNPGAGGQRQMNVRVDNLALDGVLIKAEALITDGASPRNEAHASALDRVLTDSPLDVDVVITPAAALPGDTLDVAITVTNNSAFPRSGIVLTSVIPDDVNTILETLITGGGTCIGSACERRETVTWLLATLNAGESVTVNMPPVIANATPQGTLIPVFATVDDPTAAQAMALDVVRVGDAAGNFTLEVSGSCPGTVTVDVRDGTPRGRFALIAGPNNGSVTVPPGPCAGTGLHIANPQLIGIFPLNAAGDARLGQAVGAGTCGILVQALDVSSCAASIVGQLP